MYIQFSKSIHIPSFRMNPYRGYKIHLAGCHKLDESTNAVAFPLKKVRVLDVLQKLRTSIGYRLIFCINKYLCLKITKLTRTSNRPEIRKTNLTPIKSARIPISIEEMPNIPVEAAPKDV